LDKNNVKYLKQKNIYLWKWNESDYENKKLKTDGRWTIGA
jgi:hypothetical protein